MNGVQNSKAVSDDLSLVLLLHYSTKRQSKRFQCGQFLFFHLLPVDFRRRKIHGANFGNLISDRLTEGCLKEV